MRSMIFVSFLLLVGIVAFGFYQGWFRFSTNSTDNTSSATFSMDQDKIHADKQKIREKVQDFGQAAKDKFGGGEEKVEQPERRPQDNVSR